MTIEWQPGQQERVVSGRAPESRRLAERTALRESHRLPGDSSLETFSPDSRKNLGQFTRTHALIPTSFAGVTAPLAAATRPIADPLSAVAASVYPAASALTCSALAAASGAGFPDPSVFAPKIVGTLVCLLFLLQLVGNTRRRAARSGAA
jgi:hypothetical protein